MTHDAPTAERLAFDDPSHMPEALYRQVREMLNHASNQYVEQARKFALPLKGRFQLDDICWYEVAVVCMVISIVTSVVVWICGMVTHKATVAIAGMLILGMSLFCLSVLQQMKQCVMRLDKYVALLSLYQVSESKGVSPNERVVQLLDAPKERCAADVDMLWRAELGDKTASVYVYPFNQHVVDKVAIQRAYDNVSDRSGWNAIGEMGQARAVALATLKAHLYTPYGEMKKQQ